MCQAPVGLQHAAVSVSVPFAAGVAPPNAAGASTVPVIYAPPRPTVVAMAPHTTSNVITFNVSFTDAVSGLTAESFAIDAGALHWHHSLERTSSSDYVLTVTVTGGTCASTGCDDGVAVTLPANAQGVEPANAASGQLVAATDKWDKMAERACEPSVMDVCGGMCAENTLSSCRDACAADAGCVSFEFRRGSGAVGQCWRSSTCLEPAPGGTLRSVS